MPFFLALSLTATTITLSVAKSPNAPENLNCCLAGTTLLSFHRQFRPTIP